MGAFLLLPLLDCISWFMNRPELDTAVETVLPIPHNVVDAIEAGVDSVAQHLAGQIRRNQSFQRID